MQNAERVLEPRVRSGRINHVRQRELPDSTKPLVDRMIDDVLLEWCELHETVNRTTNLFIVSSHDVREL
ncbi:MAG TPA: hypothetical protein VIY49_16525 [Bryobacteraceae bacterium]